MPPELIRVVPSAYDTSVFRFPENDDARLPHDLVYAGDLYPLKGVDIALAALPLLRCVFPDARLHVFGAAVTGWTVGSDLFVRKEWIGGDGLLLWDRIQADVPGVVHHGHVGGGVLAQALGAAGLLLLPSRSESFGIVSLEAQACGCIPVLPAEGGMPETMEPDVTGFLYSPNTPERLAETLVRLWRDSRPSRESRLRAAARVREGYSFDRSGCAFMDAVAGLPSVPQAESVGLRLRMLASRLKAEIRRRANRGAWS
jgi:glycosyltransferase involved in cell wall biosynthesis